jgi:acyl transferase domain-containing protein
MMIKKKKASPGTNLEIAVIGMAGRFPGAKNIHRFWENLTGGVESITFYTEKELLAEDIPGVQLQDSHFVKAQGSLEDIELFDASFFGYTPREAEIMDPQVRIFHEYAWEALEDAGYNPGTYPGQVGLYAGASANFTWELMTMAAGFGMDALSMHYAASQLNDKDYISTRLSYKLNLKGPSTVTFSACSTSLLTVHQACRGLLSGECKMALAGGVTISPLRKNGYKYEEGMILSPDGHCRAFDTRAAGTVFGNGIGIVVLKRLKIAAADGDHIYAVIKGSAANNDGNRKVSYTAPSIEGQAEVIGMAQYIARVEPESITYVETHGTGTPMGDPIEIEGLKAAFNTEQKRFCRIGSVKSNIGHLDIAAGIAGFIKTVLALFYRLIPPSLNVDNPNPKIDFDNSPFYVNTKLQEWHCENYPLRAGVSSFGIGGTNVHVILEEWPASSPNPQNTDQNEKYREQTGQYRLILLSAQTPSALDKMTSNIARYFKQTLLNRDNLENPVNLSQTLANTAYTLQVGRKAFKHRKMLCCSTVEEAISGLSPSNDGVAKTRTFVTDEDGGEKKIVFIFPGQGTQYTGMAQDLYRSQPLFREEMNRCFKILNGLLDYNLEEILYPVSNNFSSSNIHQTEIAQPLLFAIEYALSKLLMSWGIQPYAMMGHSIGEFTAACLSGVFDLETATRLVVIRGKLMQQMPPGAMIGIPLGEAQLVPLLNHELALAAINSPSSCVVSGPRQAVAAFREKLQQMGHNSRLLHTSHAFHSQMMDPIMDKFREAVKTVTLNPPKIPYISNVTGTWVNKEEIVKPGYWSQHLREPVRFTHGVKELLKQETIFLEVGPGRSLSTLIKQHLDNKMLHRVINLVRQSGEIVPDTRYLLEQIGQLWLYGKTMDWPALHANEPLQRLSLPTYPFESQRFWQAGDAHLQWESPQEEAYRLLKKLDITDWFYIPSWKRSVIPNRQDHGALAPTRWLLFKGDSNLGEQLVERLEKANASREVITVAMGPHFNRVNDREFTINPARDEDYNRLFAHLKAVDKLPDSILHLLNVTGSSTGSLLEKEETYRERGFYSLLFLIRALGQQEITREIRVFVLTDNMQPVTGEEELEIGKATVLGPVMVIPQEYPNIRCRSIDFVLPEPPGGDRSLLVEQLVGELTGESAETIVAFRSYHRLVQAFEPVKLNSPAGVVPVLKEGGVYLVTGGLGGIGLAVAQYLAVTVRARLILTARTPFPPRDQWDTWLASHPGQNPVTRKIQHLQELEALGSRLLIYSADAADQARMEQVIADAESHFGQVNGVIHAAGAAGGGIIQLKTPEQAEKVLAPKVKGTLVLDRLLGHKNPDFFVLFSSINAILPMPGQVDYNGANAFLDAFAWYKTAQHKTVTISIDWDTWREVGMAVEAARSTGDKKRTDTSRFREMNHPLLDKYRPGTTPPELYLTTFSLNKHWVLNEHMSVEGKGILPGVTYLEMACGALADRENGRTIVLSNVYFPTPLMLGPGEEQDLYLTMRKQQNGFEFEVRSQIESGEEKWQTHARGTITTTAHHRESPGTYPLGEIAARCTWQLPGKTSENSQQGVLVLGPRWKNQEKIQQGHNEALALLELSPGYAPETADYTLHPALLDVATAYLYGLLNPKSNYLPFSYKNVKIYRPLPGKIYSHARFRGAGQTDKEILVFDITITDAQGNVLVEVTEFTLLELSAGLISRIKDREQRTSTGVGDEAVMADGTAGIGRRDLPGNSGFLKNGIDTKEGIEAFSRVLAAKLPQVIVSTMDFPRRFLHHRDRHRENKNLTALPGEKNRQTPLHNRPPISTEYLAPTAGPQQIVADIWQQLLGINPIGSNDEFFELGGDSLKAITFRSRVQERFNVNISLSEFFNRPTVRELAAYIENHPEKQAFHALPAAEKREYYPVSSSQKRLYILQQKEKTGLAYNLPEILVIQGTIDRHRLDNTFREILRRHEIFRTSFEMAAGKPVQRIHPQVEAAVEFCTGSSRGQIR